MRFAIQWVLSLIYVIQVYAMMPVIGLIFFPWALVHRSGAFAACKSYARWAVWTARWMLGLRCEVRGTPPTGAVMIAAKHQSFLDVMMIFNAVPAGKFIMKRELLWAPVIGQYALRLGCIPIRRGQRSKAIRKMLADVAKGAQHAGQLIIYPQGSRIPPGVKAPYKIGTTALYEQLGQPCVPVATNVGLFWPKSGILRKPGLAVVEFLEPIPPGIARAEFLPHLEEVIETRSEELMATARQELGNEWA